MVDRPVPPKLKTARDKIANLRTKTTFKIGRQVNHVKCRAAMVETLSLHCWHEHDVFVSNAAMVALQINRPG